MINLFKWIIRDIVLYTLKYTPVVGKVVQEARNREVLKKSRSLQFIPDIFKTQEMCNKAVEKDSCILKFVPFYFWTNSMTNRTIDKYMYPMIMYNYLTTQERCESVVESYLYTLKFVPDHFKAREMFDKVVKKDVLYFLHHVPNWFVTRDQIQMWHDKSEYCDNFFKWYEGYQKQKAQKSKIKKEVLPIAWHPDRVKDWCISEDEKQRVEKLWA